MIEHLLRACIHLNLCFLPLLASTEFVHNCVSPLSVSFYTVTEKTTSDVSLC